MSKPAARPRRARPRLLARVFGRLRESPNLAIVLGLGLALLFLGWASGFWVLIRAAYLLLALVPIGWLWARANVKGLRLEVRRGPDRLHAGETTYSSFRLQNLDGYPKLWLEVEEPTNMPGVAPKSVTFLTANGTRTWRHEVLCRRRGRYTFGPVAVASGDPFGLFRRRHVFGDMWEVLVFPAPVELPYVWLPSAQLSGEGDRSRPTPYITPTASGVREYHPGDAFSRIHWLTTARLRRLMVKTFDFTPTSDVWLVLDLERGVHAGEGDESTEEYMVTAACSLAHRLLGHDLRVGYLAQGEELYLFPPARGPQQYERIMEALAVLEANGQVPLGQVLLANERSFGRHTTLIVITPSVEEDWVTAVQALVQRGVQAAVVLLDAGTFGGQEASLLSFSALAAHDILTYLVRRGDDLSLALGPSGASSAYWLHRSWKER
ncbi:hypothetical protein HRbin24_00342 [bacterium HR24]|nr:hypothetical protein HRbin24_00342 [bacterium HR24]